MGENAFWYIQHFEVVCSPLFYFFFRINWMNYFLISRSKLKENNLIRNTKVLIEWWNESWCRTILNILWINKCLVFHCKFFGIFLSITLGRLQKFPLPCSRYSFQNRWAKMPTTRYMSNTVIDQNKNYR